MIRVAIIGGGNVATHLAKAFSKTKDISLVHVYTRNNKQVTHLKKLVPITHNIDLLATADVYIMAISDDAIAEFSENFNKKNAFLVHTSGNVSLDSLKNNGSKGVFYPLQSFSKDKEVNFDEVPFCLEAENKSDYKILEKLAKSIGKKTYSLSSEQRKSLHVAAVFVNNFTNHLYKIGADICEEYQLPFEILHSLIKETAQKITTLSPEESQTGPAKRNDQETIQNHLMLLTKEQQEIYQLITKSIQNNGKKL